MLYEQHNNSAPVIQFGDQAPAHATTRSEDQVDAHSSTMGPAQRAAWDRLWVRLLQPVEEPAEREAA